ncbi:MAG: hypothetical protein JW995_03295 [Melioribacteraceae bacterium]|nr:hypothetical protein [Melioribacteraceae bacterium]
MKKNFGILFIVMLISTDFNSLNAQINSTAHFNDTLTELAEYIASDSFSDLKQNNTPFDLVDSLYNISLKMTGNNKSEALLLLTFATLPYFSMPLEIPVIGIVQIPLPSTSLELFKRKLVNLPSNIFYNSQNTATDKDKLSHFFGNAFISYNLNSFNLSKFMSIFVELFEHSFKVEGAVDFRDLQVNMLGGLFGVVINEDIQILPSDVLIIYYLLDYKIMM